eukprot:9221629-Ditylum_brightwellii.AAC.1
MNKSLQEVIESSGFSNFLFHPKPYGDVDQSVSNINDSKCLIVLHENGDDKEQQQIIDALKEVSNKCNDEKDMKFLWAMDPNGNAAQVRPAARLPKMSNEPAMIILNLSDQGGYYVSKETDITAKNVLKFVKNPGNWQQL